MTEIDRLGTIKELIKNEEKKINLTNNEIQTIYDEEKRNMFRASARHLTDDIENIITQSLEGVDYKTFLKEESENDS